MPRRRDDSPVFQLKVTLLGIRPPIWRRIQLRGSTRLPELHAILQVLMDWSDYHLHEFMTRDGEHYGAPDPFFLDEAQNESRVRLDQLVHAPKDRLRYMYDFGDSWEIDLVVEKVLPVDPAQRYPVVVTGKRAAPPEDVGGVWGYVAFQEAMANPRHPEHDERREWFGGPFDPEAFDPAELDARLHAEG